MGVIGWRFEPPDPLTPDPLLSQTHLLVTERFEDAHTYATDLRNLLIDTLNALKDPTFSVDWEVADWIDINKMGLDGLPKAAPGALNLVRVAHTAEQFVAGVPVRPLITTDWDISAPQFNVPDPGIQIPDSPVVQWPVYTLADPVLFDVEMPPPPSLDIPDPPTIDVPAIPGPPSYDIPIFDAEAPITDLTPPVIDFSWQQDTYTTPYDLHHGLAKWLDTNLAYGGSGLNPTTEQAIYDRALSRLQTEEMAKYEETLNYFASRGFILPPGALNGALLEIMNHILQTREDLNRDILIQQSNLAQVNTHFTVEQVRQYHQIWLDFFNKTQDRMLDAAKFTVQAALDLYRTNAQVHVAKAEVFKAYADVYRSRVQAELVKAEIYKAQIEGVKGIAEVQKAMAETYKARVEGATAYVALYSAQVQAAQVQTNINQIKVNTFRALVEAFSERVKATVARFEGFKTEVEGEKVKAEVYDTQVRAFAAQVQAFKTEVEAEVEKARAQIEIFKSDIENYIAQIQKFSAVSQDKANVAATGIRNNTLDIDYFRAQAGVYGSELEATTRTYIGAVDESRAKTDLSVKEADVALREAIAKNEAALENIRTTGRVVAQIMASALSAVSASAHLGYGDSRSDSTSYSLSMAEQFSDSRQDTLFIQHIYPHEEVP